MEVFRSAWLPSALRKGDRLKGHTAMVSSTNLAMLQTTIGPLSIPAGSDIAEAAHMILVWLSVLIMHKSARGILDHGVTDLVPLLMDFALRLQHGNAAIVSASKLATLRMLRD